MKVGEPEWNLALTPSRERWSSPGAPHGPDPPSGRARNAEHIPSYFTPHSSLSFVNNHRIAEFAPEAKLGGATIWNCARRYDK